MSKIYNWDTKEVTEINLSLDIVKKYFSKQKYSLKDVEKIFKNSYSDFKNEILRIDYFSEISDNLWNILVKQKMENNKIGDITLMASEINFYLSVDNLDRVDDILDRVEEYLQNKKTD
jgi:hypothetical protein